MSTKENVLHKLIEKMDPRQLSLVLTFAKGLMGEATVKTTEEEVWTGTATRTAS